MNFARFNLGSILKSFRIPPVRSIRSKSAPLNIPTTEINLKQHYTVVAENGVIVAWHPEKPFPYEHTQPISNAVAQAKEDESPIAISLRDKYRAHYYQRRKGPAFVDICRMFYLDKHSLFHHYRDRRIDSTVKQAPPKDI